MSYYIYDIDGTLADTSHRIHHIIQPADWPADKKFKKDWKSFFDRKNMLADPPIRAVVQIAQLMIKECGIYPVYLTARPSDHRQPSIEWCQTHVEPMSPFQEISNRMWMRPFNDHRDDDLVKEQLMHEIIAKHGQPLAMFEDRDRIVKKIRAMGIRVFHVADGNF